MKYIVWIEKSKWTITAKTVEIVLLAMYSGLKTNQVIDFYNWDKKEIKKARFRNIFDLKLFNKEKQKEYMDFMKNNEKEIIDAIHTITDFEKEIIDEVEILLNNFKNPTKEITKLKKRILLLKK